MVRGFREGMVRGFREGKTTCPPYLVMRQAGKMMSTVSFQTEYVLPPLKYTSHSHTPPNYTSHCHTPPKVHIILPYPP